MGARGLEAFTRTVRVLLAAMRPSRVSATVLSIELFPRSEDLGHMRARPRTQRFNRVPQGAAELGQFVVHALRRGWEDGPRHEAVSLQSAQREREHPL